ncbi:hypothetical protein MSMEI_5355 [Mycolicibacterium smegmatis MC2 155]|uniref:Uncharacterized protein n=1 Tax=Mycolicibacterium smegmatis (strain ATCC 700084 / mc(2)155) TaxID=246196 RepID=I7GEA3_MYCS2|nr:hypothetical protein MSMEI_5355 [Mycolicibacterium smegmatis MC2 155]
MPADVDDRGRTAENRDAEWQSSGGQWSMLAGHLLILAQIRAETDANAAGRRGERHSRRPRHKRTRVNPIDACPSPHVGHWDARTPQADAHA